MKRAAVPSIPNLDPLEDRCLMASNLLAIGSPAGAPPLVKLLDSNTGQTINQFQPFPSNFTGGLRIVQVDLNQDGKDDIIVAPGPGGGPVVEVYDGATLKQAARFFAYSPTYTGGVNIAAGDIGNGKMGIVTGPDGLGGPNVKVFTPSGQGVNSFFAYQPSVTGGVRVALGYGPTGNATIFTGTGAGSAPQIKGFDAASGKEVENFLAYDSRFRGGVYLNAVDINGDGSSEIITTPGIGGGSQVKIFDGVTTKNLSSFAGGLKYGSNGAVVGVFSKGSQHQVSVFTKHGGQNQVSQYLIQPNGKAVPSVSTLSDQADFFQTNNLSSSKLGVYTFQVPTTTTGPGLAAIGTDAGVAPSIQVLDAATLTKQLEFAPFANNQKGGVRVAVADINGDGIDDIVAGLGQAGSQVRVFNGTTGKAFKGTLGQFSAFAPGDAEGVFVAAGDVNGDGYADIIVGSDGASHARVRVFNGRTGGLVREWDLASAGFSQGVRVAVGDVNGDGRGDIVVSSGPGGNSRVCVLDGGTGAEIQNFFAFESNSSSGVYLATGDVNGDGRADIVAGEASGGSRVRVISGADSSIIMSRQFFPGSQAGVTLGTSDTDGDGKAEVFAANGPGGGQVKIASLSTDQDLSTLNPFDANYSQGLFVSGANRTTGSSGGGVSAFWVPPTISISTSTPDVVEGATVSLTITRVGDLSMPCSGYLSYGGTATNGMGTNDYYWHTGFAMSSSVASTTVTFPTYTDNVFEGDETIVVTISSGVYCTVGSPSSVTIRLMDANIPTPTLPEPVCSMDQGPVLDAFGVNGMGSSPVSPGGVSYINGAVSIPLSGDLKMNGFGRSTGAALSWSNQLGNSSSGNNGNNLVSPARPFLKTDSAGTVAVLESGKTTYLFNSSSGTYSPRYYLQNSLAYSSGTGLYTLTDTVGNKTEFYDYSTSLPAAKRGQVKRTVDTSGNTTDYTYDPSTGQVTEYQRATTVGSTTTTESYLYSYLTSGTNSGKVDTVTLRHKINSGSWDTVRTIQYTYYDTGSSNGNAGDLKLIETKDGSGNVIDSQYMRYYTSASSTGYVGGLKYLFNGPSYDRLKGVYSTPDTATDSQIDDYADAYYEYSSTQRVTKAIIQGDGCPVCTGGLGEYNYAYTTSSFADGYNNWRTKTVETLPDGNQNIIFTNFVGETILKVFKDVTSSQEWPTFFKYDNQGRLLVTANPSAVDGYDETKADLVDNVSGNYQHIRDSAGLITNYAYGSSTTATDSTAGDVSGYLKSVSIQQGETGSAIAQQAFTYIARTANSQVTYHQASSTQYRTTDGTGAQTTSTAYTWVTSSQQIASITTTLPIVTTSQNGSGSANSSVVVLDSFGRSIWEKDALGYLTYREYDQATGAVTKIIQDVDTTQTTSFSNLPSGWSTPSGGGLHLVTTMEVDGLGRTTKMTYPNGRVDYTVYKDATHEVRQYNGWDSTNLIPTGPIVVARQDWTNGYSETLTMSASPGVTSGRPNGSESIGSLESLKRTYKSIGGQVTNDDAYFNLSGLTYTTSTTFGTENTNFYRTGYWYDQLGRQTGVVMPTGTIYRVYLDGYGRKISQWVGLDDTPTSGLWSPTNTTGTDLVKVKEYEYDGGGIGDSNLTKSTQIPGGSAANRVTQVWFDWRNRPVATKTGVESSEATDVNRPINYLDFNNLNQVTMARSYDGDTVSITTTSGVPNAPSSSLLRSETENLFDEMGRGYRTLTYSVDQSSGTVSSNSLATNVWFDARGLVEKQSAPGGLVTKYLHDGPGRVTKTYLTDGGGDSAYGDADDVIGDIVLQQSENSYDSNSNVILVTAKQHFHDDTGTGELGTASTGNKARVSYQASYFDGADRLVNSVDVGTNGGSSYTRPSTVPSRSDTALVTSFAYAASGLLQDTTDPKGLVTRNTSDNLGRVTKTVEDYTNGTVTDTSNKTTDFAYNSVGRTSLTVELPSGGQQTTEWVFGVTTGGGSGINSNDMIKEVRYPDPSTGASSSTEKDTITVNALGQKLTVTDRNGTTHSYSYDTLSRPTADAVTTLGSGVDGTVRRITTGYSPLNTPSLFTSYDAASGGNVVNQVKDEFNGLGQVTKEWQEHSGAVTGTSANVQYAYSEMAGGANHSRRTSITYASGYVLNYNYASGLDNNISRLTSLSDSGNTLESYSYLGLATIVKRAHSQSGVDLSYIKLTGESVGDAGDQYTGLDRFQRIVDQRWINGSNVDVDRYKYGYDRNGNRLFKENVVIASLSEVYTYDDLNQIATYKLGTLNSGKTDVTGTPTNAQSWDYDAVGNWDSVTTNSTTQTRGANRQNEITSVSGATTPTYDNNGNLTKDENDNRFVWDAWNMMVQVKNLSNVVIVTMGRDALHRHVTDTEGTSLKDRFFGLNWQVLDTKAGSNTITRNVWSPAYVDAMVLRDRDTDSNGTLDERIYPLQDANWNTTGLVTTSGTVVERETYNPFGVATSRDASGSVISTSAKAWVFLHQGGEKIAIGDYEFRNRVLSPTLGRWLSNDPVGFNAGDVNVYRYMGNDPSNELDPSGLLVCDPGWRSISHGEISFGASIRVPLKQYEINASGYFTRYSGNCCVRDVCCPQSRVNAEEKKYEYNYRLSLAGSISIIRGWKGILPRPLIDTGISITIGAKLDILFTLSGSANTCPEYKNNQPKQFCAFGQLSVSATAEAFHNGILLRYEAKAIGTIRIPFKICGSFNSETGEVSNVNFGPYGQITGGIAIYGRVIDKINNTIVDSFGYCLLGNC